MIATLTPLFLILSLFCGMSLKAGITHYGKRGHTFPIQERSPLHVIEERLKKLQDKGEIGKLNASFQKRVEERVLNPSPVRGIKSTKEKRVFYYDPSTTQANDIKDQKGYVIVKAGTTINPLKRLSWGPPLLFIKGDQGDHIAWAKSHSDKSQSDKSQSDKSRCDNACKVVLVSGSPLDVAKKIGRWVYFDQGGMLTRKFNIAHVPARVSQEGERLKIEEVFA